MRIPIALLVLLHTSFCFAQTSTFSKVYVVEGLVLNTGTFEVIPSAVLHNHSLGITTTTDQNGYFKIVVPFKSLKDDSIINIEVAKEGYKINHSGFYYNLTRVASAANADSFYHSDVVVFYLAENNSSLSSAVSIQAPLKQGLHGAEMIRETYDQIVGSQRRENLFDRLKQGNEMVYFAVDSATGLATRLYDIIVIGKLTHVYIDGIKVKVSDINKRTKRSTIFYDMVKSNSLSKAFGKETVALRTTPPPGVTAERLNSDMKATLEIDLDQ
jgi:hypothetical protein